LVNAAAKALGHIDEPGQEMGIGVAAVVVAAGRGTRSGLDFPKQYKVMGGTPMVRASLRAFSEHASVDLVLPVIHPDDSKRFAAAALPCPARCAPPRVQRWA
jgi:2-C-methyl-D-erythritol 4-phosphate cytidylyltransferase